MKLQSSWRQMALSLLMAIACLSKGETPRLLGKWKLDADAKDSSGLDHHGHEVDVVFSKNPSDGASFNGKSSMVVVPNAPNLKLGTDDFSIALWAWTEKSPGDVLGDLMSCYDPAARTGFQLGVQCLAGVASHQPNHRHLHFGVDAGLADQEWTDCGRPGNSLYVLALCVHEGELYAGTFETGEKEAGHVYRYEGGAKWTDCGSPDRANSVMSLAVHDGRLYAGTSRYKAQGSALAESANREPGGKIFRYEGGRKWIDYGRLGEADTVMAMCTYKGDLIATPLYHRGVYRHARNATWASLGDPGKRLFALAPFNGSLFAAGNEGAHHGGVFRHDGDGKWTRTGDQRGVDQVYSFAVHEGKLFTGTWPQAKVFEYDGGETWIDRGRLGAELEVMGMAVYNGKLYAGTLPLAEVYRYDGPGKWTVVGRLDRTPDVKYRRAWSMAVHQGKLYCGVLPSGRVHSFEAGVNVTHDHPLAPGWRHIAGIRRQGKLHLYLDGKRVASSQSDRSAAINVDASVPLLIGIGAHDHFLGKLRDVRLYRGALSESDITRLAQPGNLQ